MLRSAFRHHRLPRRLVPPGFTLIELLIVIGIIALLIGILMFSLSRARKQQSQARCLSNLRQLMEAMVMYASDHDGYGPDEESQYTWDALLVPYIKDTRIYACPAEDEGAFEDFGTSYEIRDFITVDINHPERSFSGKRLLEARPSSIILLFEMTEGWHFEDTRNAASIDGSARPYDTEEFEANMAMEVFQ